MYHPCSENKGADQLRGYREADLRLFFFSHMKIIGFPMRAQMCFFFLILNTFLSFPSITSNKMPTAQAVVRTTFDDKDDIPYALLKITQENDHTVST